MRTWLLGLVGAGVLSVGWMFGFSGSIDQSRLTYASYLSDADGELMHVLMADDERYRLKTTAADVDESFIHLLLAYEDQRYYQHDGVDWLAMTRAAWQLMSRGYIVSGGSTITMQVIRLLEPKPRTVWNKLDQMRKAIALERTHSKADIMSLYLSLAPYGSNIEGIQMASLSWFGKWAHELTPAESALLVALPQSPERRRPDRHPERASASRKLVLERALGKGIVDAEYLSMALLSPVPRRIKSMPKMAPHLAYRYRQQGNMQAVTSLQWEYQSNLNTIAEQTDLQPMTNMAILLADAKTGTILAYVGSQGYSDIGRHGAMDYTQAVRSPGSTLKPFIYAQAASEQLLHLNAMITDEAISIQGYQPQNISRKFYGDITIGEALQRSLNIPVVKVLHKLGPARFKSKLAEAGILLRKGEGLPIALGGAGLTLHELVSLYSSLANEGKVSKLSSLNDDTSAMSKQLFDVEQIAQINYYLSQNTAGAGRLHGRIKTQSVAYKTGTGPGGSDAWAIGTNGNHVVGVWIGSPKGENLHKNTGLGQATPVMNKVFDSLPVGYLAQSAPAHPPEALEFFDRESAQQMTVRFPESGSIIESRSKRVPIPLIIDNANYPILAIINNVEQRWITEGASNLMLAELGSYHVGLIDSGGRRAHVEFVIR